MDDPSIAYDESSYFSLDSCFREQGRTFHRYSLGRSIIRVCGRSVVAVVSVVIGNAMVIVLITVGMVDCLSPGRVHVACHRSER